MQETVVIIGGGIAGVTVAETVKKHSPEQRVVLIDGEEYPLYSRVLLPHYIKGKIPREKVFLRTEEQYLERGIERYSGVTVRAVNTQEKLITLSNGTLLHYTALVFATGSAPRPSQGFVLQTLDDADAIVEALPALQEMHIVGGGFMACEFVNIAEKFHLPAKVYLRGSGFWNTVLPEEAQRVLMERLQAHGVSVHTAEEAPHSHTGLFHGLGAPVQYGVAQQAGCALEDGGIATTEMFATNQENIYAVGDCAAVWNTAHGRYLRVGNWQNALLQGRALGNLLAGKPVENVQATAYATDLLGLPIIFMGDVQRAHADMCRVQKQGEKTHVYYYQNGILQGAALLGDPLARAPMMAALGTPYVST